MPTCKSFVVSEQSIFMSLAPPQNSPRVKYSRGLFDSRGRKGRSPPLFHSPGPDQKLKKNFPNKSPIAKTHQLKSRRRFSSSEESAWLILWLPTKNNPELGKRCLQPQAHAHRSAIRRTCETCTTKTDKRF